MIEFVKNNPQVFKDGIGDMLFGLCRIANELDVDMEDAFNHVKENIIKKYENNNENTKKVSKKFV